MNVSKKSGRVGDWIVVEMVQFEGMVVGTTLLGVSLCTIKAAVLCGHIISLRYR